MQETFERSGYALRWTWRFIHLQRGPHFLSTSCRKVPLGNASSVPHLRVRMAWRSLDLDGAFAPATTYKVTVGHTLGDLHHQTLAHDAVATFAIVLMSMPAFCRFREKMKSRRFTRNLRLPG